MAKKKPGRNPAGKQGGSRASWLKEVPALPRTGLPVAVLAVLLVIVGASISGCGKEEKKRRTYTPPANQQAPQPPPPGPAPAEDQQPPEGPDEPGEGGDPDEAAPPEPGDAGGPAADEDQEPEGPADGSEATKGPTQPDDKPKRPEEVSDWKLDDYLAARTEGDPRLVEAVGQLGKRFKGDPRAPAIARLLAELLEPPKGDETEPGGEGQTRPANPYQPRGDQAELVEAIVAALGDNGTDEARQSLCQLLTGKLPTEDDKTAVSAALKTLAGHPCPENETILFRVLTEAEKLRPQAEGEVSAGDLREEALALVESSASDQFRTKLAQFLYAPTIPPQQRDKLGDFLEDNQPRNLGAQFVLYQNDQTPDEKKATFEEYFAQYGSQVMAHVLGVSTEGTGDSPSSPTQPPSTWRPKSQRSPTGDTTGETPQETDPNLPYRLARQLWSAPCVTMVQDRLGKIESLREQAPMVLLAGTIPVGSMRSSLWKTLNKHWPDGPQDLESAGLTTSVVSDPGLLLTIKLLPRKQPRDAASSTGTGSYDSGRTGTRTKSGTSPRSTKLAEDAKKRDEASQQWMKTSENLLRAWCGRFHDAALARTEAAQRAGRQLSTGQVVAKLPISLHEGANVVAEYQVNWPGDLRSKEQLSGVAPGPMELRYVRIEEKAQPINRVGYYRRELRLRRDDPRTVERGTWLDSVRIVPQTDRRRSIDVLITGVAETTEEETEPQDEDLIIEILSIEAKNPAQS